MSRHGALRASDADRDQVVERLRRAAAEGRIVSEELEQRVTAALRARTYDELDATVADLPSGSRSRSGGQVARTRSAGGWAVSAVRTNPALMLFALPALALTAAMLLAATIVWSVLMLVVFVLGGRHHGPPPWAYGRRGPSRGRTRSGPYGRPPGRRWA